MTSISKPRNEIYLGYTPYYDPYKIISIGYHLQTSSNKEYQFLFGVDPTKKEQYYMVEPSINWFIGNKNKLNRFRIFPTTGIEYIYKRNIYKDYGILSNRHILILITGFNLDFKINSRVKIYHKSSIGYGHEWGESKWIENPNPKYNLRKVEDSGISLFYLFGIKLNITRK